MNKTEHILTCLAEECGEVAKECHKALRFGLDDQVTLDPSGPRGTEGPTNRDKIVTEFIDLLGVYQMAVEEGILPDIFCSSPSFTVKGLMAAKADRVRAYMKYAQRIRSLEEE